MADPTRIFCAERYRLIDRFQQAASEYLRMQSAQIEAVMEGKGFHREEQIEVARRRKEEAKSAILEHQKQHGCGSE